MENNPHNMAHALSGFTDMSGNPLPGASWVGGSPAIAPRDPIFFSACEHRSTLGEMAIRARPEYTDCDRLV